MIIRSTFPQIYALEHRRGYKYWLVSGRSIKWGMNLRKYFRTEEQAKACAREMENKLIQNGRQTDLPREKVQAAQSFEHLTTKLTPYGRTVEDAVKFYQEHLGQQIIKQSKPFIRDLVDEWERFKKADTTLSPKFLVDVRSYARFIKRTWGHQKPDEPKRNEIDLLIKDLKVTNNTRRKYLKYIRMFFIWVMDEGHIVKNPTDGIKFKPDDFNAGFYTPEQTAKLLHYVATHEKDLIGYYSLLTFAGLRPTEGARCEWADFNSKTDQLYVRKGKTSARYITLLPVAVEWIKYHRKNTMGEAPFVQLRALVNREKRIRKAVFNGGWIQDGLRHGFATNYKTQIQNIALVADYMGNSAEVVKRHYVRTIPKDECEAFWNLTPINVVNCSNSSL